MSLINRVAVANLSNSNGKGASEWRPRFGHEVLNFRGQSTIVNLDNGGGKSTIAASMIGLLSRDSKLLQYVRKHACPQSKGSWSHVQVELVMPEHGVVQDDFLIQAGRDVPGETWVFGMCLHSEGDYNYYFYPGVLEDLSPAHRSDSTLVLTSNADFRATLRRIPHSQWHPDASLWRQRITQHIPQEVLDTLATFQKSGGADKDAALFNVKVPPGERFDEAFFYEILAPELLTDVLGTETEEGEERLEGMLLNHVRKAVKATHRVEAQKVKVAKLQQTSDLLTLATTAGGALNDAANAYHAALADRALDVHVLETLVTGRNVPGIPTAALPKGVAGQVAAHLIMPAEGIRLDSYTAPRITDSGLAVLLGMEVRVVNQLADRQGLKGQKISQVIEIPCDLKGFGGHSRGGARYANRSYSLKESQKLMHAASGFATGLSREMAWDALKDAVSWFEQEGDTNPYRTPLCVMLQEQATVLEEEQALTGELGRLQAQRIELMEARTEVQANEAAYRDLVKSGLFTESDLTDLKDIAARVGAEQKEARESQRAFLSQQQTLQGLLPDWEQFKANFGDDVPSAARQRHIDAKAQAEEALSLHDARTTEVGTSLENTRRETDAAARKQLILEQEAQRFTEWQEQIKDYRARFGQTSPIGLERSLRSTLKQVSDQEKVTIVALEACRQGVQDINDFQQSVPAQTPADWLRWAEAERASGASHKAKLNDQRFRLEKRLEKLNTESVAPAEVAEDALLHLDQAQIRYVPLHAFITNLELGGSRQRDLLGVFSALLFAPVTDGSDAAAAAAILYKSELPVPVFLTSGLEQYCRNANLSAPTELERHGLLAGQLTRQVECIVDPGLVERERVEIRDRLADIVGQLVKLNTQLTPLAPEGSLSQLARRADTAIKNESPARFTALTSEVEKLTPQRVELEEALSEAHVAAIRAAEGFEKAGGEERHSNLLLELRTLTEELATLDELRQQLEGELADLKAARPGLSQAVETAYPMTLQSLLSNAERFLDDDGPRFLASAEARAAELLERLDRSDRRATFGQSFPRAQLHIQYQQGAMGRDSFDIRLEQNQLAADAAVRKRADCTSRIALLKEEIPSLQELVRAIDLAAYAILQKYPKIRGLRVAANDMPPSDMQLNGHPLWAAAGSLMEAIRIHGLAEDITSRATALATVANEMHLDSDLAELQKLRRATDIASTAFEEAVQATTRSDGLTPAEQDVLKEMASRKDVIALVAFDRTYTELLHRAVDGLELLATTLNGANQYFSEDIVRIIDEAMGNLKVLQDVAKTDPPNTISHFLLKAETVEPHEVKRIIEQIIALVDREERNLDEDRKIGAAPSEEAYQKTLAGQIRKKIYRSLFKNPSIHFKNSSIRPRGQADILGDDNVSTGEKNALLMMWQLRLATYRMELAARRGATAIARRKMRMRSQTIMIIDGLFSNLSEPSLIRSVMASLTTTRGQFQLIGLVHDPKYQNDFDLFPVLLLGHKHQDQGGRGSWVRFKEENPAGSTLFTKIMKPSPGRSL